MYICVFNWHFCGCEAAALILIKMYELSGILITGFQQSKENCSGKDEKEYIQSMRWKIINVGVEERSSKENKFCVWKVWKLS